MTVDSDGPPLSLNGAALWLGRNFLEALIWAIAGAFVLVAVLTVRSYPIWSALSFVVVVGLVWALYGARRSEPSGPHASVLQFDIFRLTIRVTVGTRADPQRDRP